MAYKPSAAPVPEGEPWASMQRMVVESQEALAAADIIGLDEAVARSRVEAAGLRFRADRAGGPMTADYSATRVTATIVDGMVHEARIG